jgi:hypothetical protein
MRLPPISSPPEFAAASKLTSGPPLVFMRPRRRGYTSAKSGWRRRSFIFRWCARRCDAHPASLPLSTP